MHDPKQNACSIFSVAVISVDVKNKVLKVFCIGPHTRGDKFFHQIVGLYYLRKLTCQIIVKRLILVGQKMPRASWDYGKAVHYAILWLSMSSWHTFVSVFETSSKYSLLSTSNISSDVRGAEQ